MAAGAIPLCYLLEAAGSQRGELCHSGQPTDTCGVRWEAVGPGIQGPGALPVPGRVVLVVWAALDHHKGRLAGIPDG